MKYFKASLAVMVIAVVSVTGAFAQQATASATGTVLNPITVNPSSDLAFGDLIQGTAKSITHDNASAAKFSITADPGKQVSITITLPTDMSDGTNTLPLSFSTTDAATNTIDDAAGATDIFDPSTVHTAVTDATGGDLFVYLGGTATPGAAQTPGAYTGSITVDFAYTGN